MKTVRELGKYDNLADATVRGDGTFSNTQTQLRSEEDEIMKHKDLESHEIENLHDPNSEERKGTSVNPGSLNTVQPYEGSTAPLPGFIVKYKDNTVTEIKPGNIYSSTCFDTSTEQEKVFESLSEVTNNIISNKDESQIDNENGILQHEPVSEGSNMEEKLKPFVNINALDQPVFSDFSLSVLRFQEAIESYTQAVFCDAFESLMSSETSNRQQNYGIVSQDQHQDILECSTEQSLSSKEPSKNIHLHSCELTGENTVKIPNLFEAEIVEEHFEAQTAGIYGETVSVKDNETISEDTKIEIDEKYIEQSSNSVNWIPITILRAKSDSSALARGEDSLTITDVSECGYSEDQIGCSPVIQEVEDTIIKKLAEERITFEDMSVTENVCHNLNGGKHTDKDSIKSPGRIS